MSKKDIYKLLSISVGIYNKKYYDSYETIHDEKVNDCLLMMYFSMMSSSKEESDKYIECFKEKYDELNEQQKEIVKKDYIKILENNFKPKVKVKKKER